MARGSVQQRFCVGCAPQKLFFVRRQLVMNLKIKNPSGLIISSSRLIREGSVTS
jgi:hypothetical protein